MGRPYTAGVDAPGEMEKDGPVYVPPNARNALEVLRIAYDPDGPERFDECGWRTARELTTLLNEVNRSRPAADHFRLIDHLDLAWLTRAGLAEKRYQTFEWRGERPVVFWRVSSAGLSTRLLIWHSAGSPCGSSDAEQ